ncbi:hypothetical protein [uncultured Endozoicomonas sp.]|uniref:hypothetical protein n=1 Tax=uncultured Endozoicomonas sp. TaxID=432652 RepID=UPI00262D5FD6|nr:hypothetical protein [uncultured Endozoicomonas sp.]
MSGRDVAKSVGIAILSAVPAGVTAFALTTAAGAAVGGPVGAVVGCVIGGVAYYCIFRRDCKPADIANFFNSLKKHNREPDSYSLNGNSTQTHLSSRASVASDDNRLDTPKNSTSEKTPKKTSFFHLGNPFKSSHKVKEAPPERAFELQEFVKEISSSSTSKYEANIPTPTHSPHGSFDSKARAIKDNEGTPFSGSQTLINETEKLPKKKFGAFSNLFSCLHKPRDKGSEESASIASHTSGGSNKITSPKTTPAQQSPSSQVSMGDKPKDG